MNSHPLIVDLDGTLVRTDMLHELIWQFLRNKPLKVFLLFFWLFKGKAAFKQFIAAHTKFNPALLPYNEELLQWLTLQKSQGRTLILCTASDQTVATLIAQYLNIFDEVIASNGLVNLAGHEKTKVLKYRYGASGFDYAGNAKIDLAVWAYARLAIIVNASQRLTQQVKEICSVEHVFPPKTCNFLSLMRSFRTYQWLKNLLIFAPALAAHQINIELLIPLTVAFMAFNFCASSVYVINDLLDLESDRLHLNKRNRPFASGECPQWVGFFLAPLLFTVSLVLGATVNNDFLFWLNGYFFMACVYSWLLKRFVLIDCLALAVLYTLRLIAGAAAISNKLSFWLLAFSIFLFLSLAFIKRYTELEKFSRNKKQKIHGRGYYSTDKPLIQMIGIASSYAAVIILTLYLNSDTILQLYRLPELIWGAAVIMLFWTNWMWLQAHRGNMNDDPLTFAIRDKVSLCAGLAFIAVIITGTVGWPW